MDCTDTAACTGNLQCELTGHCAYSCSTQDCRNACLQNDDAGFAATAFSQLPCVNPCQVGTYWACLTRVSFPFAKGPTSDVTLLVTDEQTMGPVPGLQVKACQPGEDPCNALDMGTTDAQGHVTLHLPDPKPDSGGFWGYFDISSTAQPPAIVPYLYFLSYPLSEQHAIEFVSVESNADFQSQVGVAGVPLETTQHGTLLVGAADCLLLPAYDVTVDAAPIDKLTREVYVVGSAVSTTATSTDHSGLAYFINAPVGAMTVRVTPNGLGRVSSVTNVLVRAGTISFVEALPTF